jgi:predicted nucleic acid-binding protein
MDDTTAQDSTAGGDLGRVIGAWSEDDETENLAAVEVFDFGRVATALREKGRHMAANGISIAAHAREAGADLRSADWYLEHVGGPTWVDISR